MKVSFIASISEEKTIVDTEKRARMLNLAIIKPCKVTMWADDKDGALFYIAISCYNPIFNEEYKFDNHLGAINLFNDVAAYLKRTSTKRDSLFSVKRKIEFDYPVPTHLEVYRK